jgi:hypothetical protein
MWNRISSYITRSLEILYNYNKPGAREIVSILNYSWYLYLTFVGTEFQNSVSIIVYKRFSDHGSTVRAKTMVRR